MEEVRKILEELIKDFNFEDLEKFFRKKTGSFSVINAPISTDVNDFKDGLKFGEFKTKDNFEHELAVYCIKVTKHLNERSGKKEQYNLAKKILKEELRYSAGIFIFYDEKGDFRFSLIYDIPVSANKRDWSNFRRYTFFVSKNQTNKTFLKQIGEGDFSTFEGIKQAFSVEPVTRQFYTEIQNWYFWAIDKIKFPDDYKFSDNPEKDEEIRNATNLIRLITRIIFIWFLKEKKLIPEEIFDENKLKDIVKDFNKNEQSANYYNAILQNLFFGTLNQKMGERKFADEGDYFTNRKEYSVKTLYRYANKFIISKDEVINLFSTIPFLNGGLFDCLDKEDDNHKPIYIDGFSRNPSKQAIIPDYIFFQKDELSVDLQSYGLDNNRKVRGLIEILKSYNFTVDENTVTDQEIALDPELLGKVFENLLAVYNPETSTTARKATGSYYTPREIVDYMVQQSIKQYLLTHTNLAESDIDQLLSYSDDIPSLDDEQKKEIISLIDNIKILDPACGSGAFPMGILHQLVSILRKLDPDNKIWKNIQEQKATKETEEVFKNIENKDERKKLLDEINETFDENINYPDYARKLYLIENCIYGVDIQPIAIQISKLRFFISLILDQKIDKEKENFGIRALPNLETKFVVANTLIGLEKPANPYYTQKIAEIENKIKALRQKYFSSKTRKEKIEYQEEDKKLRAELLDELNKIGFPQQSSEKIAKFDPYDQNASADWFDPEWMFGVRVGGNEKIEKDWKVFHVTWTTHNSRRKEYYEASNTEKYEPILLSDEGRKEIAKILAERIKCKQYRVLALNVLRDHVHILLVCEKDEVSKIVGDLKGYSSYVFHKLPCTPGLTLEYRVRLENELCDDECEYVVEENEERNYSDGTCRKLWARKYNYTNIKDNEHFTNTIEYINNNHLKHQLPEIDPSLFKNALTSLDKAFQPITIISGFDIVIGNPPYIQLQKAFNSKLKYADLYKNQNFETFDRKGDIYCLFYEKGIQLLKTGGILAYITSNKWMRAGYGEKLRTFFAKYNPKILIDLGPNVFENATVDTNILIIQKTNNEKYTQAVTINEKKKDNIDFSAELENKGVELKNLGKDAWFIGSDAEQRLKEKIESIGKPLKEWDVKIYRGVLTGLNEAFIIDSKKREEILANCQTEDERMRTETIIKPILRGRDIKRYYYEWAGLWVIIIPAGWTDDNRKNYDAEKFIENTFPSLMSYLKPFEEKAKNRDDHGDYWWELRHCNYYPEFEKEKVVYGQFQDKSEYAFAEKGIYLSSNEYMIAGNYNKKYFLALLNSNLISYYLGIISGILGNSMKIGQKSNFFNIPIPPIISENQPVVNQIEQLVDKILEAKRKDKLADTTYCEREIDSLVYKLYDLNEEEIKIIENKN